MFLTSIVMKIKNMWEFLVYPSKYYSKKYSKKYAREYSIYPAITESYDS